jgi:hypothetical protein
MIFTHSLTNFCNVFYSFALCWHPDLSLSETLSSVRETCHPLVNCRFLHSSIPVNLHQHISNFASLLPSLTRSLTFSWRHTKTHSDINIRYWERDCHRSTTTTQLWNADVPRSSNHAEVSVRCCHGMHTVASLRTSLSDHVHEFHSMWITF